MTTKSESGGTASKAATSITESRWYIIHTYSGQEDRVKKNLEQRIETMDLEDKIFDVIVPTEEEIEIRDGQRRSVQRKMYADYLIISMVMDDESWYAVDVNEERGKVRVLVSFFGRETPVDLDFLQLEKA